MPLVLVARPQDVHSGSVYPRADVFGVIEVTQTDAVGIEREVADWFFRGPGTEILARIHESAPSRKSPKGGDSNGHAVKQ